MLFYNASSFMDYRYSSLGDTTWVFILHWKFTIIAPADGEKRGKIDLANFF